jgi:ATP-binding cassette subfamily B protein
MVGDATLSAFTAVAAQCGVETSLDDIKRQYVLGDDGLPPGTLVAIASDLGLDAKWIKLKTGRLSKLARLLPAILALRDGGALILDSISVTPESGLVAMVTDPTVAGTVRAALDEAQLSALWDGDVLLIKRSARADLEDQPFGFKWLLEQCAREKRILRDVFIAAFIGTIFTLTPPFIIMLVIDRVLVNQSVQTLVVVTAALLTMIVFEMLLSYQRRKFMTLAATRIDGRIQIAVMERLLRLPMDYFDTTPVGRTSSRLYRINYIRQFMTGQLFQTVLQMTTLIGLIPCLFLLEWHLAFFVLALAGAIFLIVYFFLGPLEKLHANIVRTETIKGIFLIESLQGMRTIKSLALESRRRLGWDQRVAAGLDARHAWETMANNPQTMVIPFERLIYAGSILIGCAFVLLAKDKNTINPGALVAFGLLAGRTAAPLVELARLLDSLGEIRGSIAEVAAVMNVPPEQTRGATGLRHPIKGEIRFDRVNFRYTPEAPLALDRASFEIHAGTIFGIMGRSGSGKTTITRLLQGLNRNYEGMIKIDGMDLREIDLRHLRTSIGVVPQENFLFSGTVRENIGMAKAGATFAQIVRAAQLAGAEEFIEKMPKGYNTELQENATNLSGGQRQRLALARALLIEPAVLILDEATSALDAESEAIINANLVRIAEGRTIICVSHRLSMLVPADAILVMEQGRAYDIGRHDELLHRCDIYKLMWHQQNRHLDTAPPYARPILART